MLVFSVTDVDTFNALQSIIDQITTLSNGKRAPPIVIVGNKSDLCHVREVPRVDDVASGLAGVGRSHERGPGGTRRARLTTHAVASARGTLG